MNTWKGRQESFSAGSAKTVSENLDADVLLYSGPWERCVERFLVET